MASARMVYGDALDGLFGDARADSGRPDRDRGRDRRGEPGRRAAAGQPLLPRPRQAPRGPARLGQGDLYVGDAAGIYLPETGDLRAGTPPPDFDLETALASVSLFGALRPERLLFSHYGPVGAVRRRWSGRPRRSRSGWRRPARRTGKGSTWTTRWLWSHERTKDRYAGLRPGGDEYAGEKLMRLSGTEANMASIMHWLDKAD